MRFLAIAHEDTAPPGTGFDTHSFHDQLWANGNVPIELQAWEQGLGGAAPSAITRLVVEAATAREGGEGCDVHECMTLCH